MTHEIESRRVEGMKFEGRWTSVEEVEVIICQILIEILISLISTCKRESRSPRPALNADLLPIIGFCVHKNYSSFLSLLSHSLQATSDFNWKRLLNSEKPTED